MNYVTRGARSSPAYTGRPVKSRLVSSSSQNALVRRVCEENSASSIRSVILTVMDTESVSGVSPLSMLHAAHAASASKSLLRILTQHSPSFYHFVLTNHGDTSLMIVILN